MDRTLKRPHWKHDTCHMPCPSTAPTKYLRLPCYFHLNTNFITHPPYRPQCVKTYLFISPHIHEYIILYLSVSPYNRYDCPITHNISLPAYTYLCIDNLFLIFHSPLHTKDIVPHLDLSNQEGTILIYPYMFAIWTIMLYVVLPKEVEETHEIWECGKSIEL